MLPYRTHPSAYPDWPSGLTPAGVGRFAVLWPRQEIYDAINELRRRHPEATTLERLPHQATCSQS